MACLIRLDSWIQVDGYHEMAKMVMVGCVSTSRLFETGLWWCRLTIFLDESLTFLFKPSIGDIRISALLAVQKAQVRRRQESTNSKFFRSSWTDFASAFLANKICFLHPILFICFFANDDLRITHCLISDGIDMTLNSFSKFTVLDGGRRVGVGSLNVVLMACPHNTQ